MTIVFLITTAFFFATWIWAHIGMQIYKGLLAAADDELDEMKSEIEEYVLDGRDFDWVEAIVVIRHWKELATIAERTLSDAEPCEPQKANR